MKQDVNKYLGVPSHFMGVELCYPLLFMFYGKSNSAIVVPCYKNVKGCCSPQQTLGGAVPGVSEG